MGHRGRLALVAGHDVDLVDLHFACQCHLRGFGHQAAAQLLRHGLHIRGAEAELCRALPIREVQAHEVEAQHPDAQRLAMAGQHRAREVVEAPRAGLAAVPLPLRLGVVEAVPHHAAIAAGGTAHPLRPALLAHQGEALGVVDQRRG